MKSLFMAYIIVGGLFLATVGAFVYEAVQAVEQLSSAVTATKRGE